VRNLCKTFPLYGSFFRHLLGAKPPAGFTALNGVTLQLRAGETVGFLGSNGAGKSTLLQLIAGTMQPTSGFVTVVGRISALLELGAGFNPEWTGRRNAEFYCMIQGAARQDLPVLLENIRDFADIGEFFDRPMRTYSSGMFLRVAFAAAVAVEPDIVIVDEALAVGDSRFQNKCFQRFEDLQQAGKTIIFVTHDTDKVTRFCSRGIVLQAGRIVLDGNPTEAVRAYRQILYGYGAKPRTTRLSPSNAGPETVVVPENSTAANLAIASAFSWPPNADLLRTRPHYNPHESSAGIGPGQIIDVQLLDAGRRPHSPLVTQGERLGIAMQVRTLQRVENPSFGIVVKSKDNLHVFGITNVLLGREFPPLEKHQTVVVCFDVDTRLSRGDYFIDVGFSEMAGAAQTILEWRMSVIHFTLQTSAEIYGFVDLNAEVSIASLPQM
jgi:lipopolysaccharide transport system ATP-binding protein